jgi:hypothetical protein
MKGFIFKTMGVACAIGALAASGGCYGYHDIVDPCYPQRYEFAARHEVVDAFAPAVLNGHVLEQTIWNYHFETGTAILTPGGMDRLAYLARRRPCPDPTIYLQVAEDILYDPANPVAFVEARNLLDSKRVQAIMDYLAAQTAGRPCNFTVVRHDPDDPSMSGVEMNTSIHLMQTSPQGVLVKPVSGGAGTTATH